MKKFLFVILLMIFLIPLASCGSSTRKGSSSSDNSSGGTDRTIDVVETDGRKIVYSVSYNCETKDVKETSDEVYDYVKEAGGYIANLYSYDEKTMNVTYKVLTVNLDSFIQKIEEKDIFFDKSVRSTDVTSTYDSLGVRIKRLEDEQKLYQDELDNNPDASLNEKINYQYRISQIDEKLDDLYYQRDQLAGEINYSTVVIYYKEKKPFNALNAFGSFFKQLGLYIGITLLIISPFAIPCIIVFVVLRKKKKKELETEAK